MISGNGNGTKKIIISLAGVMVAVLGAIFASNQTTNAKMNRLEDQLRGDIRSLRQGDLFVLNQRLDVINERLAIVCERVATVEARLSKESN